MEYKYNSFPYIELLNMVLYSTLFFLSINLFLIESFWVFIIISIISLGLSIFILIGYKNCKGLSVILTDDSITFKMDEERLKMTWTSVKEIFIYHNGEINVNFGQNGIFPIPANMKHSDQLICSIIKICKRYSIPLKIETK